MSRNRKIGPVIAAVLAVGVIGAGLFVESGFYNIGADDHHTKIVLALIEQLRSSLTSRTVIDQALGIIMAREHCTQARAFAIMRSASQNSNTKLRDIAAAIVTSVTGEPPSPPPPFEDG